MQNFRNRSANVHQFSMVPRADIPRSSFDMQFAHKTAFNSGYLVPFFVRGDILPGDEFSATFTLFARMATPIYPVMDNMWLDSQFWFVPYRQVWTNFVKMMGEQDNPGDSISYTVPQMVSKASGYDVGSLQDYMGLPTLGQLQAAATFSHSALPLRAYNWIWNQWYRHQLLQNSVVVDKGDAASVYTDYSLLKRNKRSDYFTSSLTSTQKGAAVQMPLGATAPVIRNPAGALGNVFMTTGAVDYSLQTTVGQTSVQLGVAGVATTPLSFGTIADPTRTGLIADLSSATSATINAIRLAFQTQRFLERDMRGGTRYTELITSHFSVSPDDLRLQRPQYLGGGSTPLQVNPIAQTSASAITGSTTPAGQLAGVASFLAQRHGFRSTFSEHGVVIGLLSVRADLTYQQGVQRFWKYSTRYDFPWPVFSHLGEQAVFNYELYARGDANDVLTFGYQERYAECRYHPSMITGIMRSTAALTLDAWHLAQKFTALPTLNTTFMVESPPVARVIAVPSQPEFILDCFGSLRATRPLPMYAPPGMIDRF